MRRYLPAEAAGTALSVIGGLAVAAATGSPGAAAVVAAWSENTGFYGCIAVRDYRRRAGGPLRRLLVTTRAIVVEFGPAEALDSLLLRPALMFAGLRLLPSPTAGILAGKIAADLLFYVPTILSRQLLLRRRLSTGGPS